MRGMHHCNSRPSSHRTGREVVGLGFNPSITILTRLICFVTNRQASYASSHGRSQEAVLILFCYYVTTPPRYAVKSAYSQATDMAGRLHQIRSDTVHASSSLPSTEKVDSALLLCRYKAEDTMHASSLLKPTDKTEILLCCCANTKLKLQKGLHSIL